MKYTIKIIPNSSQTKIIEEKNDFLKNKFFSHSLGHKKSSLHQNSVKTFYNPRSVLKIKLKAVPEKGKANAELIKFLAKHFKTAKSNINIIKGETGRNKIVEIN